MSKKKGNEPCQKAHQKEASSKAFLESSKSLPKKGWGEEKGGTSLGGLKGGARGGKDLWREAIKLRCAPRKT